MRTIRRRRAFTLVELLISVGILAMVFGAGYAMIEGLGRSGARLEARIDAAEAGENFLRAWRADVAASASAEIGDGGASMTIRRRAESGATREIVYRFDAATACAIREEGAKQKILVSGATGLAFTQLGAGYSARLTSGWHDGMQKWEWKKSGFAAPLAPAAPEKAK